MLSIKRILIGNIPALVWGGESEKVFIFVHGKMGSKADASRLAGFAIDAGYQVISFDLPEHGDRGGENYTLMPWNAVSDLKQIGDYASERWKELSLYAWSVGAYFSLLAYGDTELKKCLFQCPVLDMERLISTMMSWFDVTEKRLEQEREIPTPMGETLSWDYLCYTREHPVRTWDFKTHILYPSQDGLTELSVINSFVEKYNAGLTVIEGAEHYFTQKDHMEQLDSWIAGCIQNE